MSLTAIRSEALSLDEVVADVNDATAGAVVTFIGTVRNHADGKRIERLEYHAYERMAETELAAVVSEIENEIPGVRVACLHRLGSLKVGDAAVLCAASAPHRDQAFRACRTLIDRLKERVPIFKREHGPNGPYWVGWRDVRV